MYKRMPISPTREKMAIKKRIQSVINEKGWARDEGVRKSVRGWLKQLGAAYPSFQQQVRDALRAVIPESVSVMEPVKERLERFVKEREWGEDLELKLGMEALADFVTGRGYIEQHAMMVFLRYHFKDTTIEVHRSRKEYTDADFKDWVHGLKLEVKVNVYICNVPFSNGPENARHWNAVVTPPEKKILIDPVAVTAKRLSEGVGLHVYSGHPQTGRANCAQFVVAMAADLVSEDGVDMASERSWKFNEIKRNNETQLDGLLVYVASLIDTRHDPDEVIFHAVDLRGSDGDCSSVISIDLSDSSL